MADEQAASAARLRWRSWVITAFGLLAVLLAVLGFTFYRLARQNEIRANNNAGTAAANLVAANDAGTLAVANEFTAKAQEAIANLASTQAFTNAREAQNNAAIARHQASIALAALASKQLDEKFGLGILLSVEAYRLENNVQSRQTLFDAWSLHPQLSRSLWTPSDRSGGNSVAWSQDGRLAFGSGMAL